jgi:hypothetical protein
LGAEYPRCRSKRGKRFWPQERQHHHHYNTAEIGELIEGESRIDASRPTPVLTTLQAPSVKVVA